MLPLLALLSLTILAVPSAAAAGDASHRLIAPQAACAQQGSTRAPIHAQEQAVRCLTGYARRSIGVARLAGARKLDRSAAGKSADILRCDSFSHFACGRDFTFWLRRSGYLSSRCWRAAENLARGVGGRGTARSIFRTWMRSPVHRRNVLSRRFSQIGVSLRIGRLDGRNRTRVWIGHFGSRCR